jgi:hypothetical protein
MIFQSTRILANLRLFFVPIDLDLHIFWLGYHCVFLFNNERIPANRTNDCVHE